MAGIIHQGFRVGCVLVVFVYPLVCTTQPVALGQKRCDCKPTTLPDANRGWKEKCICPEYGVLPKDILQNVVELELVYSQRVILRTGNFQKFHQIKFLNISGLQFVEPRGFKGLETLDRLVLCGNYMRVLETAVFTDLGELINLTAEGTTKNKIHALENGTFLGLKKLTHLNLKDNAITEINEEHFRDLESLEVLHLSNNNLTQIKADTFVHASKLKEINLSNNSIADIDRYAFHSLTGLKKIILDGNKIKGMPKPIFLLGSVEFPVDSKIRRIAISLDDNPLRCDCHLNWISSWLDSSQICNGFCDSPNQLEYEPLHRVYKNGLPQCRENNTVLLVEPGNQLKLTCPFGGASWKTPDKRRFQEHGECEEPFCLTDSDSLIIWKTSFNLSGNYICLSSDGSQEYLYHVVVNETGHPSNSLTVVEWVGIGAVGGFTVCLLLMSVVILIKRKSCQQQQGHQGDDGVNEDDHDPLLEADLEEAPEADLEEAPEASRGMHPQTRRENSNATYKNISLKKNINVHPNTCSSI